MGRRYDLNHYTEGSTQDTRDDIADHQHMKSFVTLSDDEGEREKKENRSEYKFRQHFFTKNEKARKNLISSRHLFDYDDVY